MYRTEALNKIYTTFQAKITDVLKLIPDDSFKGTIFLDISETNISVQKLLSEIDMVVSYRKTYAGVKNMEIPIKNMAENIVGRANAILPKIYFKFGISTNPLLKNIYDYSYSAVSEAITLISDLTTRRLDSKKVS